MRITSTIALALILAGCGDGSTTPGGNGQPELPRGPVQLLVERYSRAGEKSYYTMALDGSWVAPFTGVPDDARLVVPSPDGRTLAYLRRTPDDLVHIWLMDRDGSNRRPLLEGERVVAELAWSADGSKLAFEGSTLEQTDDIWVVRADGGGLVDLTPDPLPAVISDRAPSWSPNGSRIAFTSNRGGATRLWIMNADGSNATQVIPTSVEERESNPVWSPDGNWIAFVAEVPSAAPGIGIVRPDGSGHHVFPATGEDVGRLSWTPDGRILYSANVALNYEIFRLDLTSGASENITRHSDHDFRATPFRWVELTDWRGLAASATYPITAPESPGLAAGDVNADGRADVVVLAPSTGLLRLLRGTGDGVLQPIGGLTAEDDQREVIVADLSGDGIDDIVVSGDRELSRWRGSTGGPGVATTYPLDGDVRGLVAADFAREGSTAIAAIHEVAGGGFRMMVYGSRPSDGELVAIVDVRTSFPGAGHACAGDVTGDGAPDVVVLTSGAAAPVVLLPGHGDITFAAPVVATTAVSADAQAIPVCADLDGDRRADLALLRPDQASGLTLLRSTGSGFGTPVTLPVRASAVVAADIDRDGDVDLIAADGAGGSVTVLRNRGDGQLASSTTVTVGGAPRHLIAADIDGDLWLDIVTVGADGTVSVLENRAR